MSNPLASSRLLIDEHPLQVLPSLAAAIGLNEAIFLQQLHYWLKISGQEHDGCLWIYNTREAWQEQFSFWSIPTIRRVIANLRDRGLLITTDAYNKRGFDNTLWFTIDYDVLNNLDVTPKQKRPAPKRPPDQVDAHVGSKRSDARINLIRPIPETSTETSTETPEAEAALAPHAALPPTTTPCVAACTDPERLDFSVEETADIPETPPTIPSSGAPLPSPSSYAAAYKGILGLDLIRTNLKLVEQAAPRPADWILALMAWKHCGYKRTDVAAILELAADPERARWKLDHPRDKRPKKAPPSTRSYMVTVDEPVQREPTGRAPVPAELSAADQLAADWRYRVRTELSQFRQLKGSTLLLTEREGMRTYVVQVANADDVGWLNSQAHKHIERALEHQIKGTFHLHIEARPKQPMPTSVARAA